MSDVWSLLTGKNMYIRTHPYTHIHRHTHMQSTVNQQCRYFYDIIPCSVRMPTCWLVCCCELKKAGACCCFMKSCWCWGVAGGCMLAAWAGWGAACAAGACWAGACWAGWTAAAAGGGTLIPTPEKEQREHLFQFHSVHYTSQQNNRDGKLVRTNIKSMVLQLRVK